MSDQPIITATQAHCPQQPTKECKAVQGIIDKNRSIVDFLFVHGEQHVTDVLVHQNVTEPYTCYLLAMISRLHPHCLLTPAETSQLQQPPACPPQFHEV
jgi:hypothetical protein